MNMQYKIHLPHQPSHERLARPCTIEASHSSSRDKLLSVTSIGRKFTSKDLRPPPPHSEHFAYLTGRGDHQGCLRGMRINQAKSWGINPAAFSNPSCFLGCKNYNPYEYGVGILPRSWYYFVHSCWPCVSQPRKHQATKSERRFYESVRVVSNPYPLISGRPIGNSDQLWKYELRVRWLTQSTMGLYWGAYPSRGCWTSIEVRLSDYAYRWERLELSRELQEHAESS